MLLLCRFLLVGVEHALHPSLSPSCSSSLSPYLLRYTSCKSTLPCPLPFLTSPPPAPCILLAPADSPVLPCPALTCSPPHFRLPVPSSPSLPSVDCAFLPSWSGSRPGRGKGLAASVRHHRGAGGQGKGARGTRARMEDPLKGELDRAAETEARLQDQEREREPLGGGGWGGGLEPGGSQSCRSRAGRWGGRT